MDGVYYDGKGNLLDIVTEEKGDNMEPWKERMIQEYQELKGRYERLHRMLVKYECGTLDFQPNCSLELLRRQEYAMVEYLNVLEIRAEIENVDIYREQE